MLAPGTLVQDRYQIICTLGYGGMGAVYQATDHRLGHPVALKQILHSNPILQAAFVREAQLLATLRHPALPKVTDYFVETVGQFLVMEFIPGADLAAKIGDHSEGFAVDQVCHWADQLLKLLIYLHSQRPPVVHRDIKPHNIKLNEQGAVILLDFGLAKGGTDQSIADRSLAGYTLHYAPPEQLRGEPTDARSDLYALAATLYHLLAATKPTDALTRLSAVALGHPSPLQPLHLRNPAVPLALAEVIHQALALAPEARFVNAEAMHLALLAADGATTKVLTPTGFSAPPVASNNLPAQLTSFVGREAEIEAVQHLLKGDDVRLVTLVGPGGIGKTRLVLSVATHCQSTFQDGVCFVSLAPIREPHLVLSVIAQTLGLREVASTTVLQSLQAHLQHKHLLLVLDNFEQVLDAAPLVRELLMACPRLKVLATSRAALQVRGEQAFPVPALALPNPKQLPPRKELAQVATIKLFIQRAQAVNPTFRLTSANAAPIVEICQRLDGLPLAIELAAASVKVLPVSVILARLAQRFELLSSTVRDVPDRQRTLHASIGWSYDLLTADEQALFRRLAVFRGTFNLEAAEALCNANALLDTSVLAGISALIDKSLLKPHEAFEAEPRFTMLETIREFGLQRLAEDGEAEGIHRAHAEYFCRLALEAERHLWGATIAEWVKRLDVENDNLRAALTYYTTRAEGAEQSLQLAGSLWRFWEIRGYIMEGRTWLNRALTQSPGAYPFSRWLTLHGAGNLAADHGDYNVARQHYEESLALLQNLLQRLTDPDEIWRTQYGLANTLTNLGNIALLQSACEEAVAFSEEALALHRRLKNKIGMALTINNLALINLYQSCYAQAEELSRESLALYQELGDERGVGWNLERLGTIARQRGNYTEAAKLYQACKDRLENLSNQADMASLFLNLGELARQQGEYKRAETHYRKGLALAQALGNKRDVANLLDRLSMVACHATNYIKATALSEQSIALHRELGDLFGLSKALYNRGRIAHAQQEYDRAVSDYRESLRLNACLGERSGIIGVLNALAAIAVTAKQMPQRAVHLLSAVAHLRQLFAFTIPAAEYAEEEALLNAARTALPPEAFTGAWATGQEMTVDQAVAYAVEDASP